MGAFSRSAFSPAAFSVDSLPVAPVDSLAATTSSLAVDHVTTALARLPVQYRRRCDGSEGETNTQAVLRILLSPYAELESTAIAVLTQCSIDTAVGAQLDVIGKKVGRPRNGISDDEIYRRYCRAQVTANKSDGIIGDILTIARLVIDDDAATLNLKNQGAAAFALEVGDIALSIDVATVLMSLLLRAVSAAVRPILEFSSTDDVLIWDSGSWDVGTWGNGSDEEI